MKPNQHWLVVVVIGGLLALVLGGVWFYNAQKQSAVKEVTEQLSPIARLKVDQISSWRGHRLQMGEALMARKFLSQRIAHWMEDRREDYRLNLLDEFRALQKFEGYQDVLLVNLEGSIILSLMEKEESHLEYGPALVRAVVERMPVMTDLHKGEYLQTPHISVVVPIFSDGEQTANPVGAIVLVNNATSFLYPLIQSWPTPSKSAETLLIRRDGDSVLFLNELRHQSDTSLKLRIPLTRRDLPAVQAVEGMTGFFEGVDYRGEKVVSVVLPVPDSPWFMVSKMDAAEVFADWRFRSTLILALLVVTAVLLATIGMVGWQRNEKAHFQSLYRSATELRASIERNRTTLRSIGDAVIVTDAQGHVEVLNPVAESLTGWEENEAQGRYLEEVFNIVNEHTRETVSSPVDRVLSEGVVVGLANHTLLISRDGIEHPIADSGAPIRDERGEITGVVLVFRDQAEERAAQRLMQARLELIQFSAGRSINDILTRALDIAGDLVESPIGFYHFVESDQKTLSLQQWSTRTLKEFCRAEGHGRHYGIDEAGVWVECVRRKKAVIHNDYDSLENKRGMPEGHARVVRELVVPVMRKGLMVAIMGVGNKPGDYAQKDVETVTYLADVAWEIVERKKAEAERERLMAAIEQAGEVVLITDPAGKIQYVNPVFEKVTGYTSQEVVGKNPRILKSGEQDDSFYRDLWRTISSGGTWQGRMVNRKKDGGFYTEDATISPVVGKSGKIANYVAIKRDISEEIRLEKQFLQAQKMESVGRLAGGVAHDFNNMLNVIIGNAELALDELEAESTLRSELTEILAAAQRSTDIVRQLLAFARRQTIKPEVLDLNETVEGTLKMLRRLIGEDIDLAWLPETTLWPVKMDPSQVDQILVNLCVNSRDAITAVGKITIETENAVFEQAYCADHAGFAPGDFVMLAVSDDGCGMNKEVLANIFEPFFTTKKLGEGTGLGLATVFGIVKQNEGFINVYSESGRGTTIKIYLPRYTGAAPAEKERETLAAPRGRGETVLVVEDEPSILKLAENLLLKLGYTVLTAESPDRAISLAGSGDAKIDLLITDVVMPEMSGRELEKKLRELYPEIECIFMSGYTANVIAHRGILDDDVNFIQKPFSKKDLAVIVRRVLDQKMATGASPIDVGRA